MSGSAPWRLLDTGVAPGSYNLALDEALFLLSRKGESPSTLRFYGWSPAAISVGYFQSWEREIDDRACRREGLALYRRITGGRAVLHDSEVTYSVICGQSRAFFGDGLWPAYRMIGLALAAGLRLLGVEADLAKPLPRGGKTRGGRHPSCFSSTAGYEIAARGGKLVGSAQKRQGDAILQHGSVLLSSREDRFNSFLHERGPTGRPPIRVSSLADLLGQRPARERVVEALVEGFRRSWGIALAPGTLSAAERILAARLEREKYRHPEWNGAAKKDPISRTTAPAV